jgi:hypothetical protein
MFFFFIPIGRGFLLLPLIFQVKIFTLTFITRVRLLMFSFRIYLSPFFRTAHLFVNSTANIVHFVFFNRIN